MSYLGDFQLGDTVHLKFTTVGTTGAPTTLAGTPSISVYPGSSVTQLGPATVAVPAAGITPVIDFDAVTGMHHVTIVASSGNGYATATNYEVMISAGTVGGTSVVGYVIGSFSIENRSSTKLLMGTGAVTFASLAVTGTTQFTGKVSAFNGWSIAGGTNSDALTLTGATGGGGLIATGNGAGHGILTTGGNTSGAGLYALGGTNGAGILSYGTGTGVGMDVKGGATATGLSVAGGATSGVGVVVSTTSGDAVTLTATGTSKHGLVVTGGSLGTSDGIKAVASSGVPIRGDITGNITGNLSGTVGSLAAQAKADVNAEVVDALNVDTYAEPGQGAPAATTTLVGKIGYLYKAWRNKSTQTATTYSLMADDALTVDQKATVSDDATTYTKGEVATGP